MNDYFLLVYPALLFITLFYGAKIAKRGEISRDFMSLDQTKMLRGFACLGVIIHHLTQQITSYGIFDRGPVGIFNDMGIMFTALFFFYSGYGLVLNVSRKPDYLRGFLTKRIPSVLIPFWCVNFCAVMLERFAYGVRSDVTSMLKSISGITLINSNGWFIIEILVIYLAFYIIFLVVKNRDVAIFLLSLFVFWLIYYAFGRGHDTMGKVSWFKGEWWYNSTVTFILGMYFARFKDALTKFFFRIYLFILPVSAVLLYFGYKYAVFANKRYGYYEMHLPSNIYRQHMLITLAAQTGACIAFVLFVVLVSMKVSFGNREIRYVASISTELFLIHGYFVNLVFVSYRMEHFLRFGTVFMCSLAATAILSPVIQRILKIILGLLNGRRKYRNTIEGELQRKARLKRQKKRSIIVACAAVVLLVVWGTYSARRYLFAKLMYDKEIEVLKNAKAGDEVYWGFFECDPEKAGDERLKWIVLEKEGDTVLLICKNGIAGDSYNNKYAETDWENCALRQRLNSSEFTKMFNKYEKNNVIDDGDMITLLTAEEAAKYFPDDKSRELEITESAELAGTNINRMSKVNEWDMKGYRSSWWWLKGSEKGITAPIVNVDGEIVEDKISVSRANGAIRPVIRVDLSR